MSAEPMTNKHKIAAFIRPIAHRGLHDAKNGTIENTAAAFSAAITANYAIECDLQAAIDGTAMVFHDDTLDRLIDASGPVGSFAPRDLQAMPYKNAQDPTEKIMTFAAFLELVADRVPVMVEIKNEWRAPHPRFLKAIVDLSLNYSGDIALKSFDPEIMRHIRLAAPTIPCGIVAGKYSGTGWWADQLSAWRRFRLSHLLDAASVKPDFISYNLNDLPALAPLTARWLCKRPLFAWTVRTAADKRAAAKWADAPIFEGCTP